MMAHFPSSNKRVSGMAMCVVGMAKYALGIAILLLLLCIIRPLQGEAEEALPPLPHWMHFDVIIDVGHGGIDGGASAGDVLEKDLNLEVGIRVMQCLVDRGWQVGITRRKDYALSDDNFHSRIRSRHKRDLAQRRLIAEQLRPSVFISIHMNTSSSKAASGPLVIYQDKAESYLLADMLQHELNTASDHRKFPVQSAHYYVLNQILTPSIIAEIGFLSHPLERERLQDEHYQQKIARHMAVAVEQYLVLYG